MHPGLTASSHLSSEAHALLDDLIYPQQRDYICKGGSAGHETDPSAWTLVGSRDPPPHLAQPPPAHPDSDSDEQDDGSEDDPEEDDRGAKGDEEGPVSDSDEELGDVALPGMWDLGPPRYGPLPLDQPVSLRNRPD